MHRGRARGPIQPHPVLRLQPPPRRPNPLLLLADSDVNPEPPVRRVLEFESGRIPLKPCDQSTTSNQRGEPHSLSTTKAIEQCNSPKTFFDHRISRAHKNRLKVRKTPPFCDTCQRHFESHSHLARHSNSKAHMAVVYRKAEHN